MSLRFEPVDAQNPHLAALMYGPVMLVAMADGTVNFHEDQSKPDQWIRLQDKDSLTFQAADGTRFRPFYLITTERYTTYCNFSTADQASSAKVVGQVGSVSHYLNLPAICGLFALRWKN